MTDIQPDNQLPQTAKLPNETTSIVSIASPRKSRRNLYIIIGILAFGLCLCSVLCLIVFGTGVFKVVTEKGNLEKVVDEYMRALVNKDTSRAYALFSTRAQKQFGVADLEEMLQGNNYKVFEGYQNVTITNINLNAAFNTNPDMPQGTVATIDGTITYDGGFTGRVDAILEQEEGNWRLHRINVTVPPDKFGP